MLQIIVNVEMSGGLGVLALKQEDVAKFLSCNTHIGSNNLDFQMEQYVYKRRSDGMSNHLKSCPIVNSIYR